MEIKIPFTDISFRMSLKDDSAGNGTWTTASRWGGDHISENKAMSIGAVFACVQIYSRTLGSMPLVVYEKGPEGKHRALDHPLYKILHDQPNPNMTSYTFRSMMEGCLKLYGNAYAWIEFDKNWLPKYLWPLHPQAVLPQRSLKTGELFYDAVLHNGSRRRFRAYEMLHIPGLGFDGIQGKSVIRHFAGTMGLADDLQKYGRKFFKNGARPGGVLQHPGELSEQAQERLERKFRRNYEGVEHAGRTLVLEEGMEYKNIGVPPEEAQFLESRKFSVTEIARIFQIPPHMVGDLEHATFSNIEFQDIGFAKHSMLPDCVAWEQELTRKLFAFKDGNDYEVEFLMDGLVRSDIKSRYEAYAIGKQQGFLSTNDIREKENLNKVEGGDMLYVPLNMISNDLAEPYWTAKIEASKAVRGGEKENAENE